MQLTKKTEIKALLDELAAKMNIREFNPLAVLNSALYEFDENELVDRLTQANLTHDIRDEADFGY
jgi:hypothetical protein